MMLPILISVSVTPVSYFFWALTGVAAIANPTTAANRVRVRVTVMLVSLQCFCRLPGRFRRRVKLKGRSAVKRRDRAVGPWPRVKRIKCNKKRPRPEKGRGEAVEV